MSLSRHGALHLSIMTFDIIEFELLDGKIYLFAMIDCFAEMGLGWTIGAHPTLI